MKVLLRTFQAIAVFLLAGVAYGAAESLAESEIPVVAVVSEMQRHLVLDNYEKWAPGLNWQKLRDFYQKRDFYPVWLDFAGPSEKAAIVRDALIFSYKEGLDPTEYHVPAIRYLWRAKKARSKARLELLLTDAFMRYGLEVSAGYQNPRAADFDWYVRQKKVNVTDLLESILIADNTEKFLHDLPPSHMAYFQLKEKLAYYRVLAAQGSWQKVGFAPQLKIGMRHPQVINIRKRLQQEEYLPSGNKDQSDLFDDELALVVRKFQKLHGHKVDGIVGYFTRKSLNIGVEEKITLIKQNMERWRWMPKDLGQRYIMVNMAGYQLELVENGESVMDMPVIIGKTFRATPAFIDTLKYIELNPTWKVPPRIAKEKFLPKLRENAEFLQANHLKIYDSWRRDAKEVNPASVDWQKISDTRFPFKLEQTAGPHNSMGRIKFMFPNRFRVYLHDTPNRNLFNRHVRTFSSGCIRLARPFQLANRILSWENTQKQADVKAQMASGETIRIDIKQKLPIYLMYWTVWVDKNGDINFRNDIYERNKKIATGSEHGVS